MGIFSFIKGELIEVIDWVEHNRNIVLWKFPDKDANIKYGAQLTVRESQTAVFLNEGRMTDVFDPGFYELTTANMPFMTSLQNWETGFKSPFKADVYFISTRQFTNLKWGTVSPIIMSDSKFGQVRLRAHGTYHVKVSDFKKFFNHYSGTAKMISISEIENNFRNIISSRFAEHIAESNVSVVDMVKNYSEFGEALCEVLIKEFEEFGLSLSSFHIGSTSLPDNVQEFYDKMTNMHMIDDMDKFERMQKMVSLEDAAKNEGGIGQGMGMMLGVNMADQVANNNKEESKEEILSTLKELGQLREAGVLTKTEFDSKKKDLLSRL